MIRRLVLSSLCLLIATGCRSGLTEQEYSNQFKASAEKYLALAREVANKPLPNKTGLTREERYAALAAFLRENNQKFRALALEIKKLQPPAPYQNVHTAWLELVEGQVSREEQYAASLDSLDKAKRDQLSEELFTFLRSQGEKLLDEIEKAGGDVAKTKATFEKSMQEYTKTQ
ncbi:MAG: hypothetical protein H7Y17_13195 [Chlorobia bacterium]|nr:hypothetical protein [Fimbriimonadaceae bacterium]